MAQATWARNGSTLYLEATSAAGVTNLYSLEVSVSRRKGLGPLPVLTSGLQDGDVAISPDGNRLAYTRRQERNRIWKLPLDPTGLARQDLAEALTRDDVHALFSDVSSDGTRLAFVVFRDGQAKQELWQSPMNADDARALRVADFRRLALRWSRHGSRLAYRRSTSRRGRTAGQHSIVVLSADTVDELQVTSRVDHYDLPFSWSAGRSVDPRRFEPDRRPERDRTLSDLSCADGRAQDGHRRPMWRLRSLAGPVFSGRFEDCVHESSPQYRRRVGRLRGSCIRGCLDARHGNRSLGRQASVGPRIGALFHLQSRQRNVQRLVTTRRSGRGAPTGRARQVTEFGGPRQNSISPLLASVEMSVLPDALVIPLLEVSGNIWILTRDGR